MRLRPLDDVFGFRHGARTVPYRTIMVQLDINHRAARRLQFACELALRFDAGLIGFAAAEPRLIEAGDVDGTASDDIMARQIEEIEALLEEREKEFRTMTVGIAHVSWRGEIGHPTTLLALQARAADLIVTGTGTPDLMGNSRRKRRASSKSTRMGATVGSQRRMTAGGA